MAVDRNSVIREAQKLASKGQFDKAIAEWRKLVKETPHDANIYNTIGDLCLKKNAKSEAVDAYKRAADILAEDGFTSKAIALYKKVLNIDPARMDVHLALGDMNAEKGLTGNALESYKVVADFYKNQKNMANALGIYQKMADLSPANVAFRIKLADMYVKEGMKREAVKAFLDAADVHISKDAFQDARQIFERVLDLDPNNKPVYHKAGVVYFKEGKFVEACKALKPAFESAPGNEELAALYLDALAKAGRAGDAEEVYRKILGQDPTRLDYREKLYAIVLGKKDYDKALKEAVILAEHKAESMDFTGAAALLRELLGVSHDPVAVAGALAGLFEKHGRSREGAQELVSAADGLIERGSPDDARELLSKALLLAPDMEDAAGRLAGLGGTAVQQEPESIPGGEPAGVEDVLIAEEGTTAGPATATPVERPAEPLLVDLPGGVAQEPQAAAEDREDPVITEALTEVDVLIKYGLGAKAMEQLEGLVRSYPDQLRVRSKLLDLYRDQNRTDKAVVQALLLAELYEQRGRTAQSQAVLQSALELAPGNLQIMAKLGQQVPARAEAEAPETLEAVEAIEEPDAIETLPEEALMEIPELAVPELDLDAPFVETAEELRIPGAPEEILFPEATPEPGGGLSGQEAERTAEREAFDQEPAEAAEEASDAGTSVDEFDFEQSPPVAEPEIDADIAELWAEAEFYYQQGLFDEARKLYERVLELTPDDRKAQRRIVELAREKEEVQEFTKLAEAVEGLESMVASGPSAEEASVSPADADAVRSLMQEIAEMRKRKLAAAKAEGATPVPSAPPAGVAGLPEESFADIAAEVNSGGAPRSAGRPAGEGEDADFFDLAAELRDELSTTASGKTVASTSEQSLDEIFEDFKKGVEDHEKKEDEDTHYNLGVAYREMGLLDDAISEFNMTIEGEPKFIQSRYMLGLCCLEKGDYETAITEIQNALGYSYSFGEVSEERTGMHYDLGLAYQGTGNNPAALEEFQKVSEIDPSYREVAAKLQELEQGDHISLDSIKEDIEKEVSFKFLEEGARIEREEKTKKTRK